MPQDGPQKVPGCRFIRVFTCRRGARTLTIRVFTCQRGPRRAQEADSYVFLCVFLESDRGPRRVQVTDSYVFYRGLGACAPHHMCFTVSAVVSASFPGTVISCVRVGFCQDHAVKHISRAMAPKPPQYRELRSLQAESIRSLAPLRDSDLARRGAARSSAADPGRFASPPRCLNSAEIHGKPRQTWWMLEYME